jgi:hypothetical protein
LYGNPFSGIIVHTCWQTDRSPGEDDEDHRRYWWLKWDVISSDLSVCLMEVTCLCDVYWRILKT